MERLALPPFEGLDHLIAVLGGSDTTRPIGGAVRDSLCGLPVSDIDLATRLLPNQVLERLKAAQIKAVPTGLAHGTITAVLARGPVEITTLRRDVETDGRHAVVAFTDDWQADAARRDFTINALSVNYATGAVFDYFDGVNDLKAGRVRFIGEPIDRIAEDRLRILRFFRFHARYGQGEPDPVGLAASIARANDLMALSRERIASEVLKLLIVINPAPTINVMIKGGIFTPMLPEVTDGEPLAALIAREATAGIAGNAIRRLAALIGPNPNRAVQIAARLKLSKAQAKQLMNACGWPMRMAPRADAYRVSSESAADRILLSDADLSALDDLKGWTTPSLPIGGGALIQRGLKPGPCVAATLARIENDWITAGFPDGEGTAFEQIVTAALMGR